MERGTIYVGTDGRYYGCVQVWERFEANEWIPCCWDAESGQEWVRTETDDLLSLTPISPSAVPDDLQIEYREEGVIVIGGPSRSLDKTLIRNMTDERTSPFELPSTYDRHSR